MRTGDLKIPEQQRNETTYLFATISAFTGRGGHVSRATTRAEYEGKALAHVGDIVAYHDRSEATIIDGTGYAATWEGKPLALVGSHLSNGDTIAETLQDGWGISVRDGETIPGLFDPAYVPPAAESANGSGNTDALGARRARQPNNDMWRDHWRVGHSHDGPRQAIALHGDEVKCDKSKGTFSISGTATRRCYRGKPGGIEGDLVLCHCGQNRVMASPNPGCFYWIDESAVGASSAAAAATAPSGADAIYDEQVRAGAAGTILEGYPYLVETPGGQIRAGRLDASGQLPRVHTGESSGDYTGYWGDEALARDDTARI